METENRLACMSSLKEIQSYLLNDLAIVALPVIKSPRDDAAPIADTPSEGSF
jgi:hypothetical protein